MSNLTFTNFLHVFCDVTQELLESRKLIQKLTSDVENLRQLLERERRTWEELLRIEADNTRRLKKELSLVNTSPPKKVVDLTNTDPKKVLFIDLDTTVRLSNAMSSGFVGMRPIDDKLTVFEASQFRRRDLMKKKGFGRKTLKELEEQLALFGLELRA